MGARVGQRNVPDLHHPILPSGDHLVPRNCGGHDRVRVTLRVFPSLKQSAASPARGGVLECIHLRVVGGAPGSNERIPVHVHRKLEPDIGVEVVLKLASGKVPHLEGSVKARCNGSASVQCHPKRKIAVGIRKRVGARLLGNAPDLVPRQQHVNGTDNP